MPPVCGPGYNFPFGHQPTPSHLAQELRALCLGSRTPYTAALLGHRPAVWPWATHSLPRCLCFLIGKWRQKWLGSLWQLNEISSAQSKVWQGKHMHKCCYLFPTTEKTTTHKKNLCSYREHFLVSSWKLWVLNLVTVCLKLFMLFAVPLGGRHLGCHSTQSQELLSADPVPHIQIRLSSISTISRYLYR